MTRTNNLSNTQFKYQIVFFIHIYGYIWLAKGCHWHLNVATVSNKQIKIRITSGYLTQLNIYNESIESSDKKFHLSKKLLYFMKLIK